tara:strand:- start:13 stop:573 length:561 start_codon:yes stop_codon:yes gene_type:complete
MTFGLGVPLVILLWSYIKKERALIRLLNIYWKISSLILISILLLTDHRPIGYITFFVAPVLMVSSVWFWIDLNEELVDYPKGKALAVTVKIWRWCLTFYGLISLAISLMSLNCLSINEKETCIPWNELPQYMHVKTGALFGFLFGAQWTEPLASFFGYVFLIAYLVALLQWFLIKLPKNGRIAGGF